jgi:hypothetical protein
MGIKTENKTYAIKNQFSTVIMSVEPKSGLVNYLNLLFILTKTKRLRWGYGKDVLNKAIEQAQNLGYNGVVVDKEMKITDPIKTILEMYLSNNSIREESGCYVFDSIIQ